MKLKLNKAVDAIKTLGMFNKVFLVISGDLTNEANRNEFKVGKHLIGTFISQLSNEFKCGFINILIVPGNHDMVLTKECRESNEILVWDKEEHLDEELDRLKLFFEYSNSKHCFVNNKLYDVKAFKVGDVKIQFCLLNSVPYSTRKPDDKELHFFPKYVGEKLTRDDDTHLKISVMHHNYEWFDWDTKEMLMKELSHDDIVFVGHEHKSESVKLENSNGQSFNIVMGGKFNLNINEDCFFNTVVYDSETLELKKHEFKWNISKRIFSVSNTCNITKKMLTLCPSQKYLCKLLKDNQNISKFFTDYYVLPKLVADDGKFSDQFAERVDVNDIFKVLESEKIIRITGGKGSGKTSLLKYLYSESLTRCLFPLYIEKRNYNDSRIEKMFKDMFELQYEKENYDVFKQKNLNSKIIFIDDFDLIENSKARQNLLTYIMSKGGLLIYSTKGKNQDLEITIKDKIQDKKINTLEITPFYKEMRDELVEKVCKATKKNNENKDAVISALDYMAQCQAEFINLTPGDLLQYIKYFLNGGCSESKGIKTLTVIFENNIRNAIIKFTKENEVNIYLALLEYIANYMYFEEKLEKISLSLIQSKIKEFNSKRKMTVTPKKFIDACKKAGVLKEDEDDYNFSFNDKNTFAYFVAKHLSRELEKNAKNLWKLYYIMNNICFGINDTIILFLSYIRSNTRIILDIASKATDLIQKYPEWNFDNNNIPFLSQKISMPKTLPSTKDKQEAIKKTESIEKSRQDAVKFRGIFDFNEEDAEKENFKIIRTLKYLQLIGRSLVDQYGTLECDEIETMTATLYSVTQKIIYAILNKYQENLDEIVDDILLFAKDNMPQEKISKDEIRKMLGEAGICVALNIMNDIAYNSSNSNTINALREVDKKSTNYKILELMMEENTGNTEEFVSKAIKLKEECKGNNFANMLIAQIARKHILYIPDLDYRQVQKLVSGNILSNQNKKEILLGRMQKES